jgi:hypothetical protein
MIGVLGKEPTFIKTTEWLKVDTAWDGWEKLIVQEWRRTKPVWE